jgi:hypothetical protein
MTNQDLHDQKDDENQQLDQHLEAEGRVAPNLPEGSPTEEASSQPTSTANAPEHPTAQQLADDFRSFDPANYLQRYRSALENYREKINSRWVDNREKVLEHRIKHEESHVVDWKDRLPQLLSTLAPVAAFIGRSGPRRILLITFIILLLIGVFACFGGYAIIQALAR